jgi:hypothetical protein
MPLRPESRFRWLALVSLLTPQAQISGFLHDENVEWSMPSAQLLPGKNCESSINCPSWWLCSKTFASRILA